MKFISTRGEAPALSFEGALMAALAPDGGLFMPEAWPRLEPDEIAGLAGLDYADAAYRIMSPYLAGDPCLGDLECVLEEAYDGFHHPAVAPLCQLGPNAFVLELFHGPTLAFKDLAMQVVSRFMNRTLLRKGAHATVVGATSGDTGAAAIEAFRGLDAIDVFILHPKGRISDVQRRQMTTATEANVHNIALEGTFDDCQAIVKALFRDQGLSGRLALTGVNSINFARILAQIPYYFTAAVSLGAPHRPVAFTVPTGNFGDIFAGYAARAMGLPVRRLVIATNLNDSLPRAFASGVFEPQGVIATSSPSMDIQLASNFERLSVRACRPRSRPRRGLDGGAAQDRRIPHEPGRARPVARSFRRAFGRRARHGDDHSGDFRRDGHAGRSAHRGRRRRVPPRGRSRHDSHGRAVDRPSGQVPGGGEAGDRPRA